MSARAARGGLAAYLAALVAIGFVQQPGVLAGLLGMALALAGRERFVLLARTLRAVAPLALAVLAGQLALAALQGPWQWEAMARLQLRVALMVFLGFWFVARVDLLRALSFSPTLVFVATLASSQARAFARVTQDFRLAFTARSIGRVRWRDRTRHAAAQATHLLDKAVAQAGESAQALRARGAFDD